MKYKYGNSTNHNLIKKRQDADSLSLSPHGRVSLSLALGRLWTELVMDIHNMIYNTPPWMS